MKLVKSDIPRILAMLPSDGADIDVRRIRDFRAVLDDDSVKYYQFSYQGANYKVLVHDNFELEASAILKLMDESLAHIKYLQKKDATDGDDAYGWEYKTKAIYILHDLVPKLRLDKYVADIHSELSRSSIQKLISTGHVKVNGNVITDKNSAVLTSDEISISVPKKDKKPEKEIVQVYLDEDVIVVEKPAGILTHSVNQIDSEYTVADYFRKYTSYGLDSLRPGIVHRLDRATSGLLIGARHELAYEFLKKQFSGHTIEKVYVAIVEGHLPHDHFKIDVPIARNAAAPNRFIASHNGKPAITDVRVLETNDRFSLVELRPTTGRTHQLRVHLSHIGKPILGDYLYGKKADRLFLHAHKLSLTLPSGEQSEFVSAVPQIFSDVMGKEDV